MEHERPTQVKRVMNYLHDFGSITQLEALSDLGVMRLASRMSELKKQGIPFEREMVSTKNRYGEKVSFARYKLVKEV